jgi:tetratricopeptide (TPR) repeat protein
MLKPAACYLKLSAILVISVLHLHCRTKAIAAKVPAPDVREVVAQGDSAFQKQHLRGWMQAEPLYRKAFELEASDSLKDKLLLTRFLILTREVDEDISDPAMERSFAALCSDHPNVRQKTLCDLAGCYKAGSGTRAAGPVSIDRGLFDVDKSALDAYVWALYAQSHGITEENETTGARAEKYRDSPLFVYLYLGKKTARRAEELEQAYPDFAELLDFIGGVQFQRTKYGAARNYFSRAVDLIPGYTRSLNGLANIYLFGLEDYDKAKEYFLRSLELNPDNSAALYGAALVFHHLGKYAGSNGYLDRMLASDISRGGHTSDEAVRYYQGEANYYKAYNHYLIGNRDKARQFVEASKRLLPRSDHVNYLSGLLYYETGQLQPARDDFLRVLASGSGNCDAQYYLGRILRESKVSFEERRPEETSGVNIPENLAEYLNGLPLPSETKEERSLDYFLGACSCMEKNALGMEAQAKAVPTMDLDAADKVVLQGRLINKLAGYRRSCDSLIDGMIRMVSSAETPKSGEYLNLMKEVQARIVGAERSIIPGP